MSGGLAQGKGDGKEGETLNRRQHVKRWVTKAHPFFWALWVSLLPAIAAAYYAPTVAPGYALGSAWLYRLEVGGAFFVGVFVFVLLFWLGYSGRTIRDLQLPGGGGLTVPQPNEPLDDTAEGFAGYKMKTNQRLDEIEGTIRELVNSDDETPDDEPAGEKSA